MNNDDIIENFGDLPAEEQARQEANEWAAIERTREENLKLEKKVRQLKALADEQEKIADAMDQLAAQSRASAPRGKRFWQRESERLLTA